MRSTLFWAICFALFTSCLHAQVVINELRIDQPGGDVDEFFELAGTPGTSLDSLTYLVIGDTGQSDDGIIEAVVPLTGQSIPASGYFVAAEATFTLGTADLTIDLAFENSDNVTHLVVDGFTGAQGDDLDTDDDGTLDVLPWTSVVDVVALVEVPNPPPADQEWTYFGPFIGPDVSGGPPGFVPSFVSRCPDGLSAVPGDFLIRDFGIAAPPQETPGASNDLTCPSCLAAIDLTCTSDCATGDVTLTWTNTDTYDSVEIYRNGGFLDAVGGTDETYTDVGAPADGYEYQVIPVCDIGGTPTPAPPVACSLIHAPYNGERHLIFVGEENGGAVASADELAAAFGAIGETYILIDEIETFACFGTFVAPGNMIWLMLGTTPNDYELTDGDAAVLVGLVDQGIACYLEGPDHFAWNPTTVFHDYDGCDNAISMPGVPGLAPDGDDSLSELDGLSFAGLDLSGIQDAIYTQDSSGGNDYTDRLVPATADALGTGVSVIWQNSPDAPGEIPYNVGLYYVTDGTAGNVIATSFEFGGLGGPMGVALDSLALDYVTALDSAGAFETDCTNGVDDDGDGDVDCDDSDCAFTLTCFESDCSNGADEDGDGLVDCDDPDCLGDPACAEVDCGDGIDNDGDTLIDCDDPDCAADPLCGELDCGNGVDDDGDGDIDCDDSDCDADPLCAEICDDGIDNDGDSFIDCDDFDCSMDPACAEICDDGIDNDGDGFIDCDDFFCIGDPACGEADCGNGVDDDGDGDIDCADADCAGDPLCAEVCDNGIDDDGDGDVDCADADCMGDPACAGEQFERGDSNNDGALNIADSVYSANALFVPGSPAPACLDAADANDDGAFNIADVIWTANWLFVPGSAPPPAPFGGCGVDPSMDSLDCALFDACP